MTHEPCIPASIANANGERVTTRCTLQAIGTGVLIQGIVFQSGGNGFYYPMTDLDAYLPDGGAGYLRVARALDTRLLDGADWQRPSVQEV